MIYFVYVIAVMNRFQRCQKFSEFSGPVCRYSTKRRLIKGRVRWLPVVHRRTISHTLHLERWRKRHSDIAAAVRPPSVASAFFISDNQWAQEFIEVSGLSESSDEHEVVIFHVNPGNGVLTESLLELCDHKHIAWEPRKLYGDHLKSLKEAYQEKFACCSISFTRDNQLKILDEVSPVEGSTDDARYHAKIVGNVPEMSSFIPKLVQSLSRASNFRLCRFGVVEPILIVTGFEYRLMTEAEHFWWKLKHARTAMYELFLRTELLTTVPLSAFNHGKQFMLKPKTYDYDRDNLYVVRLSLAKDLDARCNREDISGILLLLRVISNIKARRVIPALEHLCPDVGLPLLELGVSMMDRFSDIPPNMWPDIYHAVTSGSQFSCSPLYHIFQQRQHGFVPP